MKKGGQIFLVALALMLGVGWFLAHLKSFQRLGRPGVKVVAEPVYGMDGGVIGTNSVYLPERVLDYTSKKLPVSQVVLDWLPEDTTYGQRVYRAQDGFEVAVNAVLMGTDRTSIHKPQYCLTGVGWQIERTEADKVAIKLPHAYDLPVMKLVSKRSVNGVEGTGAGTFSSVFVYWFVADGQLTCEHEERMWWMARDLVFSGVLQRWAYVSCFAVCQPGMEEATYHRMAEWIAAAVPEFQLATGEPARLARGR